MNYKALYSELVDLADKSDISTIDIAQRAINNACSWCLHQYSFLLNEGESSITYPAGSTPLDLSALSLHLIDATLATGEPIDIIPYSVYKANQRRELDLAPAGTYDLNRTYTGFHNSIDNPKSPALIQLGNTFKYEPEPTVNVGLVLHYQKAYVPLAADSDTNFLLDNLPDLILLRCLCMSTFRTRINDLVTSKFPPDLFLAEWENAKSWDARMRSTGRLFL